jgi:hypothetical protein
MCPPNVTCCVTRQTIEAEAQQNAQQEKPRIARIEWNWRRLSA